MGLITTSIAAALLAGAAPARCPLEISFGSYAMGIDSATLRRVDALLARDRGVRSVDRRHWGREGEITLCVKTRRSADARRLAYRVRTLLPARPRGPVTVSTRAGLRFHAPRT
jgi:hypothetical protein